MKTKRMGRWVAVLAIVAATACAASERAPRTTSCGSPLTAVSYDAKTKVLTVAFANGYAYEYWGVPKKIFEEVSATKSRAQYFARNIRGKFDFHCVIAPTPGTRPVMAKESRNQGPPAEPAQAREGRRPPAISWICWFGAGQVLQRFRISEVLRSSGCALAVEASLPPEMRKPPRRSSPRSVPFNAT